MFPRCCGVFSFSDPFCQGKVSQVPRTTTPQVVSLLAGI